MTRISRISAPRATVTAVVLLVVAMLGFGILAEAEFGEAEAVVATRDAPTSERAGLLDVLRLCRS